MLINQLVEYWKMKFADNLLGVAVSASVARGEDQAFSDLALDVFLWEKPTNKEDYYLKRGVDGMLIEALYHTPNEYLQERSSIPGVSQSRKDESKIQPIGDKRFYSNPE